MIGNTTHISGNDVYAILSDQVTEVIFLVNYVVLCACVSVFGAVANVINLIVYYKQGLDTTINISFFSLAISDLCSLTFQQLFNIFINPLFERLDLPIVYEDVQFVVAGVPRAMFSRITCMITAFITAERCLCVVFPLHIKRMITTKVTTAVIIFIFAFTLLSPVPFYCSCYFTWKLQPHLNRTILTTMFTEHIDVTTTMGYLMQAFFTFLGFLSVLTFTLILTYKLRQKSTWRQTVNCDLEKAKTMSKRDRATITMVVLIASILVVCYTPAVILCLTLSLVPDFSAWGILSNLYHSCWSVCLLFENINSSVNIFLYYKMSSKYRQTLKSLFFKPLYV